MNRLSYLITVSWLLIAQLTTGQTVGLTVHGANSHNGYLLMSPISSNGIYLINDCGESIHEWTSAYKPGLSAHLLPDGSLMRTGNVNNASFGGGGSGGVVQRLSWDNDVIWEITLSDDNSCQHHDIYPLDLDRFLVIVWEKKPIAEAIALGRTVNTAIDFVWSEKVQEIVVTGENTYDVIWEWKAWDHLVQDADTTLPNYNAIENAPRRIDINYVTGPPTNEDWLHFNSIAYNAELDQIVLSVHNFSELWIIDHSTTTAEAASSEGGDSGYGGDILYRWGNPQTYDQGTVNTRKLYGQHHVTWIPTGFANEQQLIMFNNGLNRPQGDYSSIERISLPWNGTDYTYASGEAFAPSTADWTYTAEVPEDFYSSNISGVYPLPDGGSIITAGSSGKCFQINAEEQVVWEYINPVSANSFLSTTQTASNNTVFRFAFYSADYTGVLNPDADGEVLELDPVVPNICETQSIEVFEQSDDVQLHDNVLWIENNTPWVIINLQGQTVMSGSTVAQIPLDKIPLEVFIVVTPKSVKRIIKQ